MIRSSACQRQADTFPALSGRHGERRSYTTLRDTILSFRQSDLDAHRNMQCATKNDCFTSSENCYLIQHTLRLLWNYSSEMIYIIGVL